MFRESEGIKLFETDCLSAAPTNDDEVNIDVQKVYGRKYDYGPLSIGNHLISVPERKPLSLYMESRYVLPNKILYFAKSKFYPPMSVKSPAPFVSGIKSEAVTS